MDAYDDLHALSTYSRVPIAGGELHTSGLPELKMMIERKCYSIFQPDAIFTGGIAQTWKIYLALRDRGIKASKEMEAAKRARIGDGSKS